MHTGTYTHAYAHTHIMHTGVHEQIPFVDKYLPLVENTITAG